MTYIPPSPESGRPIAVEIPLPLRAVPLLPGAEPGPNCDLSVIVQKAPRSPIEIVEDAIRLSGYGVAGLVISGEGNRQGLLDIILTLPLDDLAALRGEITALMETIHQ